MTIPEKAEDGEEEEFEENCQPTMVRFDELFIQLEFCQKNGEK